MHPRVSPRCARRLSAAAYTPVSSVMALAAGGAPLDDDELVGTVGVSAGAPLTLAAAVMAIEQVHRLPVLAPGGAVVGVLSALDLLRWLAEADGYRAARATRAAEPRPVAMDPAPAKG